MPWAIVASVLGTAYASKQAGKASDAQINAAHEGQGLTQAQYDQTRNDLRPFYSSGVRANDILSKTLGLGGGGSDLSYFETSPGYQFRLAEGNKALERSAAARGMTLSGAQLKALSRYNQGTASQEFGNWFDRLSNIAGAGQNAAVQTGQFGANAVNAMGNYGLMAGNAAAEGITNRTNLITGGLEDLATLNSQRLNRSSGYRDGTGWWKANNFPTPGG